jgi:hypothetical protein
LRRRLVGLPRSEDEEREVARDTSTSSSSEIRSSSATSFHVVRVKVRGDVGEEDLVNGAAELCVVENVEAGRNT